MYSSSAFRLVESLSKFNLGERQILTSLTSHTFNEEHFFSSIKVFTDVSLLIKLCKESPYFNALCKQEKYRELWNRLYSTSGSYITSKHSKKTNFYIYENEAVDVFDLLRGAYLYYVSKEFSDDLKEDFSTTEINLLRSAMEFNSIHATQRYHQYIYQKIEKGELSQEENATLLLRTAVNNCKKYLNQDGSYAYMMLAEAYFHYAKLLGQNHDSQARSATNAAIKACEQAEKHLEKSKYSIHNASLGDGLARSNSFGIHLPSEAKDFLQQWARDTLSAMII